MTVHSNNAELDKTKVQHVSIDAPKPETVTPTTPETDTAKGEVVDNEEGRTLRLVAALPLLMRHGLNIVYAKDRSRLGDFAMENHKEALEHVYTVIGSEANATDVSNIGQLGVTAKAEGKVVHVLVLNNELSAQSEFVQVIKDIAEKTGMQYHTSLTTMLQGEEENVSI